MTEHVSYGKRFRDSLKSSKVKLVGLAAAGTVLVSQVSAASTDINGSVGPVLDSIIAIFPTLLALILAAVPIIIVIALIAFVLGIFDGILGKIKI